MLARNSRNSVLLVAAALILFAAASCGSPTSTPDSPAKPATAEHAGDSPQAVFRAAREAAAAYRWKEFCSYLTPDARDTLAASLSIAGNMMRRMAAMAERAGNAQITADMRKKTDPVVKVLDRHGVPTDAIDDADSQLLAADKPPRELIEKIVSPISDPNQFIADIMEALLQVPGERPFEAFAGELADVKIDGNHATGTLVLAKDGKEDRQPVEFRKIDGQWRIEFAL